LRALNVRRYFLDFKDVKYVAEDYHKKFLQRSILKEGDVVITKIGTIGVSAVIPNIEANTTASCGKIRINKEFNKDFNPYYLSSFFNTLAGKLLIEMDTTGSVQTGIILKTLRNVEIPKIDYDKQQEIAENIRQGIKYKEQAENLMKEAIKKVEYWIN
jgi:type I restriction enzyme, S subunit